MRPHPHFITHRHWKSTGFTLVELLVVIAIIAVLGALTTVGVRGMMARAHESNCAGNMRQLGVAIHTYIADNGGRFPGRKQRENEKSVTWDRKILPYIADPNFDFTEKANNPILDGTAEAVALGAAEKVFRCPADTVKAPARQFKQSYAMTYWTTNDKGSGYVNGWESLPGDVGVPLTKVSEPSRTVMLVEYWSKDGAPAHIIGSDNFSHAYGSFPSKTIADAKKDPSYHKGRQNILFVDGSVGSCSINITDAQWLSYNPHPVYVPR